MSPEKLLFSNRRNELDSVLIEFKGRKFLIIRNPTDINSFIANLKQNNVNIVIRASRSTYDNAILETEGIPVRDLTFEEGNFAPKHIINEWLTIVRQNYIKNPDSCLAIHSTSGLGRASVLVALALIELGLKYEEAVELIRSKQRGAINAQQLSFLEHYRPKKRLRRRRKSIPPNFLCLRCRIK